MAFFSFYKVRKPRQFSHTPIYFDPRKEALEERIQKAKKEMGIDIPNEEYKPNIKGTFSEQTNHLRRRQANPEKGSRSTQVKLAVILILLLIAAYYFFIRQ